MCPEMILGLGSTLGPPGGTGGQVNRGHKGDSFLKTCILGIFGDISSNLGPGGQVKGGPGGPVFLKSAFLVFLVMFLQT